MLLQGAFFKLKLEIINMKTYEINTPICKKIGKQNKDICKNKRKKNGLDLIFIWIFCCPL